MRHVSLVRDEGSLGLIAAVLEHVQFHARSRHQMDHVSLPWKQLGTRIPTLGLIYPSVPAADRATTMSFPATPS